MNLLHGAPVKCHVGGRKGNFLMPLTAQGLFLAEYCAAGTWHIAGPSKSDQPQNRFHGYIWP